MLREEKRREWSRVTTWDEKEARGWSDERCVWGIAFKEVSNAVSRLVNSLKLEEVRWSEVNIKAMVLKSGRDSACSDEECEETRASVKDTRKGKVGAVKGSSNSTNCSAVFFVPSLFPPQIAKRVFTNPRSFANC